MMKISPLIDISRLAATALLLAALTGCGSEYTEKDFVGKWKSSRLPIPVLLNEHGEWELLVDNSGESDSETEGVRQFDAQYGVLYGVWQYFDGKLMWSFRVDTMVRHDPNPVVSVTRNEFKLRENDGSISTFTRLE